MLDLIVREDRDVELLDVLFFLDHLIQRGVTLKQEVTMLTNDGVGLDDVSYASKKRHTTRVPVAWFFPSPKSRVPFSN